MEERGEVKGKGRGEEEMKFRRELVFEKKGVE